jgi:hypothetical protein
LVFGFVSTPLLGSSNLRRRQSLAQNQKSSLPIATSFLSLLYRPFFTAETQSSLTTDGHGLTRITALPDGAAHRCYLTNEGAARLPNPKP